MKKVWLWGCLLVLLSPAMALAANVGLNDVIRALEGPFQGNGVHAVRDVQADFFQESRIEALDRIQRGRGRVSFSFEPGDGRRAGVASFNWEYDEPNRQEIVSDGRTMWVYLPENRQVIESDISQIGRANATNPVTFLSGLGNLSRDFSIMWAEPNIDSGGNFIVELRPRQASELIRNLVLVVDRDAAFAQARGGADRAYFPILSSTVVDPSGNRTIIEFRNIRVNLGLSPFTFRFTLPPGVEVVRPTPGAPMGF